VHSLLCYRAGKKVNAGLSERAQAKRSWLPIVADIVQEYVFYVFQNPKTRLFTFFEVAFQKKT